MAKLRASGEFIMERARDLFYKEFNYKDAMSLLVDSLQCDEMTQSEIKTLAIQILNGEMEIYDTDDGYDVRAVEPKDERYDFYGKFADTVKATTDMKYDFDMIVEVISQICLQSNTGFLESVNNTFYYLFGKKLFDDYARSYGACSDPLYSDIDEYFGDIDSPRWKQRIVNYFYLRNGLEPPVDASLLSPHRESATSVNPHPEKRKEKASDFIDRNEKEYGFIDRDGKYYPVPFGNHEMFAEAFAKEKYKQTIKATMREIISNIQVAVDYLVYKKGFIVLHNPAADGARAIITRDEKQDMTNAQRDFLYDYLYQRGRIQEANDLYKDDETIINTPTMSI